jgi:hypothetical protein
VIRYVDHPTPYPVKRFIEKRVEVPYDVPISHTQYVKVPVEQVRQVDVPYPVEEIVEKIVENVVQIPTPVQREYHTMKTVYQEQVTNSRAPTVSAHGTSTVTASSF